MDPIVLPLHKYPKYLTDCCSLINSEWKRSETARLRSLNCSCDSLPTSLILVQDDNVIGHAKLSSIPSIKDGCFVESVVIHKKLRGRGYGTFLMEKAEDYCKTVLNLNVIYLSTKGQEEFYHKLGYSKCQPISIYGSAIAQPFSRVTVSEVQKSNCNVPAPPPLPNYNVPDEVNARTKTYMRKRL